MNALKFLVGWLSRVTGFTLVDEVSPSQMGYRFEHRHLIWLINRLQHYKYVEFLDAHGAPIDASIISQRYGRDGGIDAIIHIVAPDETRAKWTATRVRTIIRTEAWHQ